jgi:Cu2+-exporting ATPase
VAAIAMSTSSLIVIGNSLRLALPARWNREEAA